MKSLTCCQGTRARVGGKTVRMDSDVVSMRSLTCYQANRSRGGMKSVKTILAAPAMRKSPTSCQANRTKVGVKAVRIDPSILS